MRRIVWIVLLAALMQAVLQGAPARAYVPEQTPHRSIAAAAHRVLEIHAARIATPALVVMRGGRTLFSLNETRPMIPASLMKLVTTTTAMVRFGPSHRFVTRALVSGSTLYLVGGGDPTLATNAYRRGRFFPKPKDVYKIPAFASASPTTEDLAARIVRAGVRSITAIVCDASRFDGGRTPPSWPARFLTSNSPESGLLSALTVDEGFANVKQTAILPRPSISAGEALRAALATYGVGAGARIVPGRAPANAREVARTESPPLDQIVEFTNHYSINFDAEILLKNLGAEFGGAGSTAAGVTVVRATMRSLGIPLDGLTMDDGSGLSAADRIAPHTLAMLLTKILTGGGPVWSAMRASLPVAGGPGTLIKRMTRAPAAGNLRAKTGSIDHVRGMAGWVRGSDGVPIVFVAMFNGAPLVVPLAAPLDLLGYLLAGYPAF